MNELQAAQEAAAAARAEAAAAAAAAAEAEAARREAEERAAAQAAAAEHESSGRGMHTTGFALIGVASAGLITTIIGGAMAASEDSRLVDACDFEMGPDFRCTEDDVSSLRTRMLVADIGLGVGIAAGVVAVVLLLIDGRAHRGSQLESAVLVGPDLRRDGGGASLQLAF